MTPNAELTGAVFCASGLSAGLGAPIQAVGFTPIILKIPYETNGVAKSSTTKVNTVQKLQP